MPGVLAELDQIDHLRPAIALAKRVDVIDIADDFTSAGSEGIRVEARKKSPLDQPPMHIRHPAFDETAEHKGRATLRDFERTYFTRPIVNVLKKVTMNRAEMGEIEVARWRPFRNPLHHPLSFPEIERVGIENAKLFLSTDVPG